MLPPIEGTGMAEDPEVKALMKLKGLESAFVHADEFAQIFCRELFLGPRRQSCVILARTFPAVQGTLVRIQSDPDEENRYPGGVHLRDGDLPMIDSVEELDLIRGKLAAKRTFSQTKDQWLPDHKPFQFLKHPLVSGIMAVETLLEAAHLLYPHLSLLGVRRLRFEDILECPEGVEREARIHCQRQDDAGQELLCDVQFSSAGLSPAGRISDKWSTNYRGQVILGPRITHLPLWPDFAVQPEDLETRSIEPDEMQDRYEQRTGLRGRYRVLKRIHGAGPEAVKGEMTYIESRDIAGLNRVHYHYSPYLLEALMQLLAFHGAIRQEEEKEKVHDLIPFGIEEFRYTRPARNGEGFVLEGRARSRDEKGITWDARALDPNGIPIMLVRGMRMNRFSP
jgi:hypothetical protein